MSGSRVTDEAWEGPVALHARAMAPDLARGAALLLIAVANAHLFLFGHPVGIRGYAADPGTGAAAVALLQAVLVDGRAYPMFGALFGYGLVLLGRRPAGRSVLRRRCGWMLLIGFAHAVLLFSGDIVAAYGLLGLLLGARITAWPDRRLLVSASRWLLGPALVGAAMAAPVPPGQRAWLVSMTVDDPAAAVAVRLGEWVVIGGLQAFGVAAAVLVGAWAGRRQLLHDPASRRAALTRIALLGPVVAVVGGLPLAVMAAGIWPDPPLAARLVAGAVHGVSGYGGGFGYAALAGLAAIRLARGHGRVVGAVVACGQRSLSCYLAQSVVFVAVLAPYGGGWGHRIGLPAATGLAVVTWALTVVAADLLRRRGSRGPAEAWLRRRTYVR